MEDKGHDEEIVELVKKYRINDEIKGSHRWYFEGRDGRLPFVKVSADGASMLEMGEAAIVQSPTHMFSVVGRDVAERIMALDRSWICFFNG